MSSDTPTQSYQQPPRNEPQHDIADNTYGAYEFRKSVQIKRCLWPLALRFFATCLSIGVLCICLREFQQFGLLDKPKQRSFNTLAILLSGIMSLAIGSMFGILGAILRWPLLARAKYSVRDVDLILSIQNPTGSWALVWEHTREGRWTLTSTIVFIFLIITVIGRLSVAGFGLTFNLADEPNRYYPIRISDWSLGVVGDPWWLTPIETNYGILESAHDLMINYIENSRENSKFMS
ncbi:hypothetical protein BDZ91DRAFT_666346 [Kalaharituber pfeilii]|nr:hypothetical protein BDZ91DRAFT_666346 [Kalaharituber pfeilii]